MKTTLFFPTSIESMALSYLKEEMRYLISGVGPFKSMYHAMKEPKDRLIILAGVAGGRRPLKHGDLVLGSSSALAPAILERLGGNEIPLFGESILPRLRDRREIDVNYERICTVLSSGHSPEEFKVEAMEGYGVASAMREVMELRVISNIIGDKIKVDRSCLERLSLLLFNVLEIVRKL